MATELKNNYPVRISNSSINSYGTRVLTDGMDIDQYNRNPILLYMHFRDYRSASAIGHIENVRKENDDVTGDLVFDDVTDLSQQIHGQWDAGTLKMVSAGIDILAIDETVENMAKGQTLPTITKSKLNEVSVVDIGANDDALELFYKGEKLNLAKGIFGPLKIETKPQNNKKDMESKELCLMLGLPETATEAQIKEKMSLMKQQSDNAETLQAEKEALTLAAITTTVETAIKEGKIPAAKKDEFVTMGKKLGNESLKTLVLSMNGSIKPLNLINTDKDGLPHEFKKLSEVPADRLLEMRKNDKAQYMKLYKAEYGVDCPELKD